MDLFSDILDKIKPILESTRQRYTDLDLLEIKLMDLMGTNDANRDLS